MKTPLFLAALLFILISFNSFADEMLWHSGQIVLKNDEVLRGDLSYDYKNEVIQCKQNGRIKAFSTYKVNSFSYIDSETNTIHRFVAISEENNENYSRKNFYEVVLEGDIYLLRKRNKALEPLKNQNASSYVNLRTQILCYDYFILTEGEILPINRFKKNILPILYSSTELDAELKKYIDRKDLKLYYLVDQILLIGYYNQLRYTENNKVNNTLTLN